MILKPKLKVVFIGVGSAIFGPATIYDILSNVLSKGDILGLVDIDKTALTRMHGIAETMAAHMNIDINVESSTERIELLPGADAVIIAAEEDRIERWEVDWRLPREFGIRHTLGENRGPSGLSHTLRTVPLVLDMVKDVERLSPNATVVVMTNPEDRIGYALQKYTSVRSFGFCDGLWDFKHNHIEPLLDIPGDRIFVEAAGINHAVWITGMIDTATGKDLYSMLLEKARQIDWQPFGRYLYERFGLWPHENDEHYGEYFGYACDYIDCTGYDFDLHRSEEQRWKQAADEVLGGTAPIGQFVSDVADNVWGIFGDTPPSLVFRGIHHGVPQYLQNANVRNGAHIPGLPADMIVEIPGVASPTGIHGVGFHHLNAGLLSILHREGAIQRLTAEAAVEGSRNKALTALEMDSHVCSVKMAEDLLEAFLDAHRDYIPPDTWRRLKGLH